MTTTMKASKHKVHCAHPKGDFMSATQRLRVSLIGVLGVILAVVGFAGPATAAPYSHHASTSVSNSHPTAGSSILFCGAGFQSGERVSITLDRSRFPSVTASKSGSWCTRISLSSRLSGNLTLTATGTRSHLSSSTRIHIEKRHGHDGHDGRVLGESLTGGSSSNSAFPAGVSGEVAGVSANAAAATSDGLASTGTNAIGAGALGGLLLLGGAAMVLVSRRRKVNV
jgi:LPXTG-motif cell wall-anchored protein